MKNPFESGCVAQSYDLSAAKRGRDIQFLTKNGLCYPAEFGSSGGEKFYRLLDIIRRYTTDIESFLEVGCGTGAFFETLRKNNFMQPYTGIDLSKEHIGRAQSMYQDATFQTGNVCALDFSDHCFSFVFENNVMPFVVDPETAIREMVRVSNGYVFFKAHATPIQGGVYCYQPLYMMAETEVMPDGKRQCYLPEYLAPELRPSRLFPNVVRELPNGRVKVAIAKMKKKFINTEELDALVTSLRVEVIERIATPVTGYGAIMTKELTCTNTRDVIDTYDDDCRIGEQDVLIDVTAQDVEFLLRLK